jgi:hypothetical protein
MQFLGLMALAPKPQKMPEILATPTSTYYGEIAAV